MAADDEALRELAARVTRLEEQLADRAAPQPAERDTFWVLDSLRRRSPRPALVYAGIAETPLGEPVAWQMGHDSAALLEEDWTVHASALAALGHPSRLQILQLVARAEATTAAELAHTEGLGTTGQIYHHLRQLVSAGWLRGTTKGRHEVPAERLVPLLVVLAASRPV
jgi:hypothetical protein